MVETIYWTNSKIFSEYEAFTRLNVWTHDPDLKTAIPLHSVNCRHFLLSRGVWWQTHHLSPPGKELSAGGAASPHWSFSWCSRPLYSTPTNLWRVPPPALSAKITMLLAVISAKRLCSSLLLVNPCCLLLQGGHSEVVLRLEHIFLSPKNLGHFFPFSPG